MSTSATVSAFVIKSLRRKSFGKKLKKYLPIYSSELINLINFLYDFELFSTCLK